jgi:hypothetical protein
MATVALSGIITPSNVVTTTSTSTLTNKTLTSPTVTGVVVSDGTANGVTYLNGSKVLTSGTALTFDGTNLTTTGYINVANDSFTGAGVGLGNAAAWRYLTGSSGYIAAFINNSETLRLTSTGLGIGTSSPSASDWNGSATVLHVNKNDTNGGLFKASSSNTNFVFSAGNNLAYIATTTNTPITFFTNTTERTRIDTSGNFFVAKTAGDAAVVGCELRANGAVYATRSTSTNDTETLGVYSTGASAYRFYVGMGGTVFATSIVISAISDQRLKENVRDLDTGLNSIMALQPRRFDWKEGKGQDKKDVAGFIAQEFETVFPECVGITKAGADGIEYKNINHETLIPTLVKAIQEQQALIQSLTARLDAANL